MRNQREMLTLEGTLAGDLKHRDKVTLGRIHIPDDGKSPVFGNYPITIFSPWIRNEVRKYKNAQKVNVTGYFYRNDYNDEIEFRVTRLNLKKKARSR